MTHSIPEPEANLQPGAGAGSDVGPDPVIGAAITLFGIFMMGVSGAADAHYAFDLGVLTAVGGAGTFVVCVALSALKQRKLLLVAATEKDGDPGDAPPVDL